LALIVAAFTSMAFLRTLIVMGGFGLPTDPAHVCLVLFTMGAVGLLPLGVGTGPAAMVSALGATSLVTATAAGLVISAATMIAVLIYAGAVLAWRIVAERPEPNAPDNGPTDDEFGVRRSDFDVFVTGLEPDRTTDEPAADLRWRLPDAGHALTNATC
jgi:hypothetical protein